MDYNDAVHCRRCRRHVAVRGTQHSKVSTPVLEDTGRASAASLFHTVTARRCDGVVAHPDQCLAQCQPTPL